MVFENLPAKVQRLHLGYTQNDLEETSQQLLIIGLKSAEGRSYAII